MKLEFALYKDKMLGCWTGKNIGGVLGAPFECMRQWNDIEFYTQDLSDGPPPNDDLDLQIVWLAAVERFGRQVDARVLAEYWLSYIVPRWCEYGVAKANLSAGFSPPFSGHVSNQYRNSCGCFIRSEIWACLAPGRPELAVRYAYEDAIVDHAGEGVYGEVFCAAVESAAFVEADARKLIDIGLSYIPAGSAVARCVRLAIACHEGGVPLREAREHIHNAAPGTFGGVGRRLADIPTEGGKLAVGDPGFDCPENVGYVVAGWLYGEGDFGRSLCAAVACGEDTDCTAATLGAILGILSGASGLPEKWTAPVGGKIATLCIDIADWGGVWVPQTVEELTDRILRVTPVFLGREHCDILAHNGYAIACLQGDALFCPADDFIPHNFVGPGGPGGAIPQGPAGLTTAELVAIPPHVERYAFPTHWVLVDYMGDPYFSAGETRKLKVIVMNSHAMHQQMWCRIKLYMPDGVRSINSDSFEVLVGVLHGDRGEATFEVDVSGYSGGRLEMLVDISFASRHTNTPVKVSLIRK